MAELTRIKQISLSDGAHEIDAKYWNGHEFSELKNIAFTVVWEKTDYESTTAPTAAKLATIPAVTVYYNSGKSTATGTLPTASIDTQKIYLIYKPNLSGNDNFEEYVYVGSAWERIGGTGEIDLTNFAKKGTITLTGEAASAGAATITSSNAGAQTASGTATVTYKKSDASTGSAGAATVNTTSAGGVTVSGSNFTFTGTTATISGDVSGTSVDDITYQPKGTVSAITADAHSHTVNLAKSTITYATGAVTSVSSNGAHTHTVDSHTHGDNVSASKVTAYTAPSMTAISFTPNTLQSLTTKNYGFSSSTSDVMTAPTVSSDGVLSWTQVNAGTQDALSAGAQASLTGGVFSAGTFTYSGVTAAGAPSAATLTSSEDGSHTHTVTLTTATFNNVTGATLNTAGAINVTPTFTGTTATLTHTVTEGSVSISYQPAGSISGSQTITAHSHSVTIADHTHSIGLTDTTITGTAAVAVSSHTHTVTVANHTHSVSVSGNNY